MLTVSSPGPASEPGYSAQVTFTACDDGLICFPVQTESGRSLTFVLDTGNVNSYVTSERARELGWPLQEVIGKDGKPLEGIQRTDERSVRLGSLSLGVRMLAFPREQLGPAHHKVVFDGGLAFTDLKDRIVQIDYPRHRLRISDVQTDVRAALPGKLQRIKFGAQGPAILTGGPFELNGQPLQAQIDTCFTGTLLIYDAALDKLHLREIATAAGRPRFFPNTDGGVTMRGTPARSVRFGSHDLGATPPVIYFPTPGVHQPDGLFEATVGNELLRRSVLTLDLHNMTFDVTGRPRRAATDG